MTPKEYLKKPYSRCFIPAGNGSYTAYIREFPGCVTEWTDFVGAAVHLEAVAEGWIAAALELGQEIPEPIEGFWGKS